PPYCRRRGQGVLSPQDEPPRESGRRVLSLESTPMASSDMEKRCPIDDGPANGPRSAPAASIDARVEGTPDRVHDRTAGLGTPASIAAAPTSPLAIVVVEPDGTVRLWSAAAEWLFGRSAADAIGAFHPGIPEAVRDEYIAHLATTAQGSA